MSPSTAMQSFCSTHGIVLPRGPCRYADLLPPACRKLVGRGYWGAFNATTAVECFTRATEPILENRLKLASIVVGPVGKITSRWQSALLNAPVGDFDHLEMFKLRDGRELAIWSNYDDHGRSAAVPDAARIAPIYAINAASYYVMLRNGDGARRPTNDRTDYGFRARLTVWQGRDQRAIGMES